MVLSLMRRHAKSWLIKFLIGMIAVVFIFYFGYSFTSRGGVKIGYVNGEPISGTEYQKTYRRLLEALQRDYKNAWSENLIEVFDLKNRALENLINQKLVSQEAKRIGLDITEQEIQKEILAYPAFQYRGRFDESRYRALLSQNRMKPEDFEASIAQDLLQRKLRQFLMTFSPVTEQEVLDQYTFSNQKMKISFVQFQPKTYEKSVTYDQKSMEAYFEEHKEEYRVPEKIKISYITMDPEMFKSGVSITDKQIKDYYEENKEMFRQEKEVSARHILLKVDRNASEEEERKVREKAKMVLEKARKGEDFPKLAKKYSEGPTAQKGGDLGYFSEGRMVKPFEEAAFKMKKGEISELVRTQFGYHIIKVEDVKEERARTLDEVREEIKKTLTNMAATDLAHEKALSLIDQMPYDVVLDQYAERQKVPTKQSGYFSSNETIPDIGGDDKLRKSIFSFERNDVSEVLEFGGKFYIIQVVDKKTSHLPELKDVKEKVKKNFTSHLATLEAKSAAEDYLAQLKGGKDWKQLAKERNLTPKTTEYLTRNDYIPQIGYAPELQEAAFSLNENRSYPEGVFQTDKGVIVIKFEGRKGVDMAKYEEEKENYRISLMRAKNQVIFGDWLEELKGRAEIQIVQPVNSP
ncbi:MAG: SurA N-terminal domain-containing protein [Deltaproteobacteria bacterium]|nr:MAG: SurA N-terminal domain-containing protein [Deltaproteobacteria bacterium]